MGTGAHAVGIGARSHRQLLKKFLIDRYEAVEWISNMMTTWGEAKIITHAKFVIVITIYVFVKNVKDFQYNKESIFVVHMQNESSYLITHGKNNYYSKSG